MSTYLADTAEDLTVEGPSATFTYRRIGPRGGVPLVLLNRFLGTLDWWDPELLDLLAADHDVIVFDYVGVGYTDGTPHDSVEGLADGTVEFIEALGLAQVDLLGWTLGGTVAQQIARTRPALVRRLVVVAASPGSDLPGAPPRDAQVGAILAKGEVSPEDMVFLFFPDTDAGRAAGRAHLARVATRLATGRPAVSEAAQKAQAAAIAKSTAVPFEQVKTELAALTQPVLYVHGTQDIMIPDWAAYLSVQHTGTATLVLYSDAGHALPFQHTLPFATQVNTFLAA
ncbi:alpha/beta fold hydrolase [Streptomyces coeruleorubidus]